jgi:hypothetical protein
MPPDQHLVYKTSTLDSLQIQSVIDDTLAELRKTAPEMAFLIPADCITATPENSHVGIGELAAIRIAFNALKPTGICILKCVWQTQIEPRLGK